MARARQLGDVGQPGGPPGAAKDTRGLRAGGARGALVRLAFGLVVGLLLAEALVRLLGLTPQASPRPRMLENDDKSAGLECYPVGRADPAPIDLREPARLQAEAARSGLASPLLVEVAEQTPFCVPFSYNAHTRRDGPFTPVEGPSVLVVGDSFAEGAGVERQHTFAARLEAQLPARVFHAGRRGLDQPELAEALERLLPATRPEVVLYALTLNDFEQEPAWAERQLFLNDLILDRQHMGSPDWKLPRPLRGSALARLVAERRRSARATRATLDWYRGMTGPDNAAGWSRTRADLVRMGDASERSGARLVVAIVPLLVGLDGDYPFEALHAAVADACDDAGIEHVDLLPALSGQPAASLHVHPVDMHPNAEAHRLIAEALVPVLRAARPRSADPPPPATAPGPARPAR